MEYNSEATVEETVNGDKGDEDARKVFVGGLSWQSSAKDLRTYFEKFGTIEKATLKTDSMTGESRGFGFILFEDKASVEAVMAETNHMLGDKKIGARRAKPAPKPDPILKIFIGGLDKTVTEETVRSHFEAFGTISEIILPMDRETKERRNFAFIKYETEEFVDACIASNNSSGKQNIAGNDCDVKKSAPKDQYGGRGGGRGGFGGRGRGGFGMGFGGFGGYGDYYGGYGGYDYSQDYYGGYGPPRGGGFGRPMRSRGRGRGRGFAPY